MEAKEFNQRYPIGTEVILTGDDGKDYKVRTRSSAWEITYGVSVVEVTGSGSSYDLRRIRPYAPYMPKKSGCWTPTIANCDCPYCGDGEMVGDE